ncbi:thiopurine S-methyltransferase, partial [Vibrio sinaloensis]
DLVWLATKHADVQGVELSNIAVRAFFSEHFYTPMVMPVNGQHELFQFDELSIYVGDFFTAPIQPVDIEQEVRSLYEGYKITELHRNDEADMPPKLSKIEGARMTEVVYLIES